MKLVKPSFEILPQSPGLEGIFKQIEIAGRTCYKSEDKITPDSAKAFVERMIKSGHGAMLEHGTVYLYLFSEHPITGYKYRDNKYSKYFERRLKEEPIPQVVKYITTNYRVLVENNWLDDLQYLCEPTEYHEKRFSVKFICDRGVSHEFVRHRVFSFAQESTRYCNYSKDKFSNELTFVLPNWMDDLQIGNHDSLKICNDYYNIPLQQEFEAEELQELTYLFSLASSEISYLKLIETGWKPQQARAVLPNSLKTELVMTGFVSDWKHFFLLRSNKYGRGGAHPQSDEVATVLYEEFNNKKYIID